MVKASSASSLLCFHTSASTLVTKYSILCLLVSTDFVLDILTPKGSQMKSYNYIVLELVEHCNFDIGYVTILVNLKNSKF